MPVNQMFNDHLFYLHLQKSISNIKYLFLLVYPISFPKMFILCFTHTLLPYLLLHLALSFWKVTSQIQKKCKHQVRGYLEGLVHLLTLPPWPMRGKNALLFLLKGTKETGRIFRFRLSSSWLSKLEIIRVCDTSGYSNWRPQKTRGGNPRYLPQEEQVTSQWNLNESCAFLKNSVAFFYSPFPPLGRKTFLANTLTDRQTPLRLTPGKLQRQGFVDLRGCDVVSQNHCLLGPDNKAVLRGCI